MVAQRSAASVGAGAGAGAGAGHADTMATGDSEDDEEGLMRKKAKHEKRETGGALTLEWRAPAPRDHGSDEEDADGERGHPNGARGAARMHALQPCGARMSVFGYSNTNVFVLRF